MLRRVVLLRCLAVPMVFTASVPLILAGQTRIAAAVWIVTPPLARAAINRIGAGSGR